MRTWAPVVILPLILSLVVVLAAVPQIGNGGFEQPPGVGTPSPLIPGWDASTVQDGAVLDAQSGGADLGMPSEGSRWIMLGGTGSVAALPPSNPGGFGTPPQNAVAVSQSFSLSSTADTLLMVRAVFLSNEDPGTPWQDFLSVDVSDGVQSFNLIYLDTNSPMVGASLRYLKTLQPVGMPGTAVVTGSADLPALFPNATTSTVFTLTLSVGNLLDASLPSRGYFDGVEFQPGTPINPGIQPTALLAVPQASGGILLRSLAGAWPYAEVYNLFSGNVSQPLGAGPLLGIVPDQATYFSVWQPLGTQPFHVLLDGAGLYEFLIPAGVVPAGVQADAVMVVLVPGAVLDVSAPVRITF